MVGAVRELEGTTTVQSTNGRISSTHGINGLSTHPAHRAPALEALPPNATTGTVALQMRSLTRVISVLTEQHVQFLDITDHVAGCLAEAGIRDGFVVVFSRHTTAGIRINENEPLLLEDMAKMLESIAPAGGSYRHDDFSVRTVNLNEDERNNGHSHCRSLLLGASETIPVAGGNMLLGRWQRIFLAELDGPLQREFVVQVIGG